MWRVELCLQSPLVLDTVWDPLRPVSSRVGILLWRCSPYCSIGCALADLQGNSIPRLTTRHHLFSFHLARPRCASWTSGEGQTPRYSVRNGGKFPIQNIPHPFPDGRHLFTPCLRLPPPPNTTSTSTSTRTHLAPTWGMGRLLGGWEWIVAVTGGKGGEEAGNPCYSMAPKFQMSLFLMT